MFLFYSSTVLDDSNSLLKNALDEFSKKLWSSTTRDGLRIMGFGHVESGELETEFLFKLVQWSDSVGLIEARNPGGRYYSGTVFRIGPCHVMTCWHVVKGIYSESVHSFL